MEDRDSRVLIAFALSFAVLLLWRFLLVKEPPPRPKPPATAASQVANQPAPVGQATASEKGAKKSATAAARKGAEGFPVVEGTAAEEVVVEGDLYRVTFSTQGAVVRSWVLKKYTDANQQPLDVVNQPACEKLGYPISLSLAMDQTLASKLNSALYVVKPSGGTLAAPVTLEFVYSDGHVEARKQFTFGRGYEVGVKVRVSDGQRDLPAEVAWRGGFGDHSLDQVQQQTLEQAVYSGANGVKTVAEKKLKTDEMVPGPLYFGGVEDRYFGGIFLPASPADAFRIAKQEWIPPNWNNPKITPNLIEGGLVSPEAKPLDFRLFVGPKDLDVLRAVEPPLDGLLDFGFFGVIAKPLFICLRYIFDHWVHNWGWAIVILTILINLAMFPLKLKSVRSAQEMQRVAPIIKGIQDRYKQYKMNDPRKQKMNQEIMKIYSEHGINPLGGCLPMLPQLPILYAFYRVLELPIELRHAPWIWWIKDLSQPDTSHIFGLPVPILPTLMIVTMFIAQKMTPMPTADPQQKTMMFLMPLVFGIMFYRFASGLVLYFMAANVVGIAQQALINKMTPRPAALTAPEKAGAGKV